MKFILSFWRRDIINKLIVIVFLALVGGVFAFGWLIFNMPQGKSLSDAFANFIPVLPSPTFDINSYLTPNANVPAFVTATMDPVSQPTFTPPPSTPTVELPLATLEILSTPTPELSTQTVQPLTQAVSTSLECIPSHPGQTGKVVEVLDGNTVRVLIDKLVYVVRYIGVAAPADKIYSKTAKAENSKLVYGKEVTLIADVSNKDPRGRLLRYVIQGNTFINQQLIQEGLGAALDVPPDSACTDVFKQTQQTASTALIGVWSLTATPTSP